MMYASCVGHIFQKEYLPLPVTMLMNNHYMLAPVVQSISQN